MNLKNFSEVFKSLWGAAVVIVGVGPLALWLPELQPPWPTGSAAIATLSCSVAVILGYITTTLISNSGKPSAKYKGIRNWVLYAVAVVALCAGMFTAGLYVQSYAKYVITESQLSSGKERTLKFVIGDKLRTNVVDIAGDEPVARELLKDFGYQPELVWTAESILKSRLTLLFTFSLAFSLINYGLSVMAALMRPIRNKI